MRGHGTEEDLQKGQSTRDQLVAAAQELFARDGY